MRSLDSSPFLVRVNATLGNGFTASMTARNAPSPENHLTYHESGFSAYHCPRGSTDESIGLAITNMEGVLITRPPTK